MGEHLPQLLSASHWMQVPAERVYPKAQTSQMLLGQLTTGEQVKVTEFNSYPAMHEVHWVGEDTLHEAHGRLHVLAQLND